MWGKSSLLSIDGGTLWKDPERLTVSILVGDTRKLDHLVDGMKARDKEYFQSIFSDDRSERWELTKTIGLENSTRDRSGDNSLVGNPRNEL